MDFIGRFKKDSPANSPQTSGANSVSSFFSRPSAPSKSDTKKGLFASSDSNPSGTNGFGSMFGLRISLSRDPKVSAAKQKLEDALVAEKMADKALADAKKKVRAAKEEAKNLEREALEESKRAKAKEAEAKLVSKTAKGLGRHG